MIICCNVIPHKLNPEPINYFYIHTFTAFWISLVLINMYEMMKIYHDDRNNRKQIRDRPHSYDIIMDFQLFASFTQMMLCFYLQNYWLAWIWTFIWVICLFYRGLHFTNFSLKYPKLICAKYCDDEYHCCNDIGEESHDYMPIGLVLFFCIFVIAMFIQSIYMEWLSPNFGALLFILAIFYLFSIFTRYSYYRSFLLFQMIWNWSYFIVIVIHIIDDITDNAKINHIDGANIYGAILSFLMPIVILTAMWIHESNQSNDSNQCNDCNNTETTESV